MGAAASELGPDRSALEDLARGGVEPLDIDLGGQPLQLPAPVVELAVALAQRHEIARVGETLVIVVERMKPALLAREPEASRFEAAGEVEVLQAPAPIARGIAVRCLELLVPHEHDATEIVLELVADGELAAPRADRPQLRAVPERAGGLVRIGVIGLQRQIVDVVKADVVRALPAQEVAD